jgi:hypothetical protein
MTERTYHIGIMFGGGRPHKSVRGLHQTSRHLNTTAAIYASESLDCLPCELHRYYGEHITTKKALHEEARNGNLLQALRQEFPTRIITRVIVR